MQTTFSSFFFLKCHFPGYGERMEQGHRFFINLFSLSSYPNPTGLPLKIIQVLHLVVGGVNQKNHEATYNLSFHMEN